VLFSTHLMEQAEKVCDAVCIIARGKKVLDGKLRDIQQASAAEGVIALAFSGDPARARAEAVLADRALVAATRPPRPGEPADCEVVLGDGVASGQLLAALLAAGVELRLFEVVVPTLHQIFVARVGAAAAVAERRPDGEEAAR
jgi:ABC-2 type transport system ATP-binding protein